MSKRRLVITVVLAGASQSEVARTYGVSQGWISKLMARYRADGEAVFEPRSRRPHSSPGATPAATVELIVQLRKKLSEQGLDAGAQTIRWHLTHQHRLTVSRATINRALVAAGTITPDPSKRPRSWSGTSPPETPSSRHRRWSRSAASSATTIEILGYAPETVLAMNGVSTLERGTISTRWRDYVDIVRLASIYSFDDDLLLASAQAVADYRGVHLIPVGPMLTGYDGISQPKWTAWRRNEGLEDIYDESRRAGRRGRHRPRPHLRPRTRSRLAARSSLSHPL